MRHTMLLLAGTLLATSLAVGCGDDNDDNTPTAPSTPAPSTPAPSTPAPSTPAPSTPAPSTPPPSTPPPSTPPPSTPPPAAAPATAAVNVGDIFFTSALNGSSNPAVDTVAVNGVVTWTWAGSLPHSIQSTGSPSFTSSGIQTGVGQTYSFTFTTPGTYQYDCAVHGQLMTGTIVVMAASGSSSPTPILPPPPPPPPSTPPPAGY